MMLCGSVASWMGNPGQAGYACANGFMDAFAAHHGTHEHIVSIAWPLWKDGRMMITNIDALREGTGMVPMTTDTAMAAMTHALNQGFIQSFVMTGEGQVIRDKLFASAKAVLPPSSSVTPLALGKLSANKGNAQRQSASASTENDAATRELSSPTCDLRRCHIDTKNP